MSSTHTVAGRHDAAVACALVAQAAFLASPGEIAGLRKSPGVSGGIEVPPAMLRHADEQTVVGLAAVLRAIEAGGLKPDGFGDWAVLVAPRYLGRSAFERAFPTFRDEGAWGVSPHLIPAHSLHSPSGTISQALKAHGPNLGVGGTAGGELDAFLFAATLLRSGLIPGAWVVLTGRVDEHDGRSEAGDYEAMALAITSPPPGFDGPIVRVSPLGVQVQTSDPSTGRWLDAGRLRADDGRSTGPIPRPHFRPSRES